MERYFKYLMIRPNNRLEESLPSINRKMLSKMKEYYNLLKVSN